MASRPTLLLILLATGATWAVTVPMAKIAVTGGHRDIGIIFWQFFLSAALLGGFSLIARRPLPLTRPALGFYALIAMIGTVLPNWASLTAAIHLPAGIMSIVIATVPMMALPIAVTLGIDRYSARRLAGLGLGVSAVALLAAPETGLPTGASAFWLLVALIAPFLYAVEGNVVAKWDAMGLDAVQVLLGASLIGCVISAPIALGTGAWIDPRGPWDGADWAVVIMSVAHVLAYTAYVWLVRAAGAVFTAQVGYIVTVFGVFWARVFLGESYPLAIWLALAMMLAGLALVQPRRAET